MGCVQYQGDYNNGSEGNPAPGDEMGFYRLFTMYWFEESRVSYLGLTYFIDCCDMGSIV
jgi:hypothetical protein